jgi:hypothetical protein
MKRLIFVAYKTMQTDPTTQTLNDQVTDLTICTVSYNSADWMNLNVQLVNALNPDTNYNWVIVENSPPDSAKRISNPMTPNMSILEGADIEQDRYAAASHHHGSGLNIGIQGVHTRYLLVLDPDFYIIKKDWIASVLQYMMQNQIYILGAPWHPSRYKKWRYFPCAHCTFYDLKYINKDKLDFRPDYDTYPRLDKKYKGLLKKFFKLIDPLKLAERRHIGHSADTGYRIYMTCNKNGIRNECFAPVFSPSTFSRFFNKPFSDGMSLLPKKPGYYSETDFAHAGLPDFRQLGCEEFFWNSNPFGFHVRSFPKRNKAGDSLSVILQHLDRFISSTTDDKVA